MEDGTWTTQDPAVVAADPNGAWAAAMLGTALGVYVDRTLNAPPSIQSSSAYGMDENGNLYQIGRPTTRTTVPMTPVANKGGGNLLLLLLIGFAVMEMRK